jgi:hypothetical protein
MQAFPRPQKGQGWRKGGDHTLKEDFSRAFFVLFKKKSGMRFFY